MNIDYVKNRFLEWCGEKDIDPVTQYKGSETLAAVWVDAGGRSHQLWVEDLNENHVVIGFWSKERNQSRYGGARYEKIAGAEHGEWLRHGLNNIFEQI